MERMGVEEEWRADFVFYSFWRIFFNVDGEGVDDVFFFLRESE